jgi:dUTP pyrophosphatase
MEQTDTNLIQIPDFKFALRDDLKDNPEFLPSKANNSDTGYDIRAASRETIITYPNQYLMIPLGFRVFSPEGYWLKLVPRSSTFIKKHLHALYGTIDQDWAGECCFCCQFILGTKIVDMVGVSAQIQETFNTNIHKIEFGDRIGQLIPVRRQEMGIQQVSNEEIDKLYAERNSSRKDGGFGSTGVK